MRKEIPDSDRFLLFMALIDPKRDDRTEANLINWFGIMTGWEENRVRSAFEVCVVKGHIGGK